LHCVDQDLDVVVDLQEFARAALKPWPLETWVRSLPLHQILVDCLPRIKGPEYSRAVGNLSENEIKEVVDLFSIGLHRVLREAVQNVDSEICKQRELEYERSQSIPANISEKVEIIDDNELKGSTARAAGNEGLDYDTKRVHDLQHEFLKAAESGSIDSVCELVGLKADVNYQDTEQYCRLDGETKVEVIWMKFMILLEIPLDLKI
jgi:hypothetical protein